MCFSVLGPGKKYPIRNVDGTPDVLNIVELEMIFGLPKNYTNVNGFERTLRQGLIGRSWSVQVIEALFRCLDGYCVRKQDRIIVN